MLMEIVFDSIYQEVDGITFPSFGASVSKIAILLTNDFVKWVAAGTLIAWPIVYYFMNRWLDTFAYHIEPDWKPFVLGAALSLVLAILTVSFQVIKAARKNPVDALRYE